MSKKQKTKKAKTNPDIFIGYLTKDFCKRCGADIYANKNGDRWCSKCTWEQMRGKK